MWAGRRTGKGKGQRDRVGKTSIRTESFQARVTDLDPIRVSPYGPAACHLPHREAGHTTAPDRMHRADQKLLASTGASTHVPSGRGIARPAAEFGAHRRPISSHSGHSLPPPIRAITAWRNAYQAPPRTRSAPRHTYVIPSASHHARSATFGEAGPFTNRSGDRHLITLNERRAT